ncbi:unnamed protein product [Adineta steineri]|uniref:Helicase domino-like n=1 Tax=Adineta steineri TaxID=433720 RepID=A0A815QYJ0_9BILA|nr:unnamed protein product [Adineta steineri]CAF1470038.1 unnamed protein product [Adineta steineri]
MTSAVTNTAMIDDDITSNTYKRRRSSIVSSNNEPSIEQSPSKRVRSSSPSTNLQTMFSCLNNIVQSHRSLVREYIDLQMRDRTDLSIDEQRFIKAEEDLIEKVEKNLQDINISLTLKNIPSKLPPVERVKHENDILKRIDELKSNGKWSNQRLVKFIEPKKRKTHWDYLLDEMRWLAEDFAHEKRWKQMMAKKLSLAILKYFREKNQAENQQQRDELKRLRKQALFVCKEVMNFWKNMHKVAEFKETTRIQELRKHQLDLHLNFIVDQTEKYSDWLVKSLKTESNADDDDKDFNLTEDMNDDDNEETIEREEEDEQDEYAANELKELEADREESINDLLKRYYGIDISNSSSEKENNIPIDIKEDDKSQSPTTSTTIEDENETKQELVEDKEMNDLATTAQALQPTGFTLNTTEVKTPVPFLIKHSLREYQHVGLDWLVTLYENKLNCILADEMGLGKTIQTIALLAHLACEKGVWGPHLIVVPTSVMLNWELEFKKWCPAFKILTYYGSVKERQLKRQGWTKVNAFHVCITSYKLVLQDAKAFRRKKWKYLILDEAQNIKNFKSQRWQTLLNFHSQRRLLLTGTPLQNSLMELWSLMHFLMPNLFASHHEFREWFSNPLTEMIEQGQTNANDSLIKRLHKVLRPFILRRLKVDVEKQMPKKHEHVIMCHLSKRQRQLYDDFIQCKTTRDTIQQGHYMSVINILMQLRKVCNHPDLFESRPIISPFTIQKKLICYEIPRLIEKVSFKNPYLDFDLPPNDTFLCFRIKFTLQATRDMIFDSINHIDENNRHIIQLTSDIIDRYRNSSLWYQANVPIRNTRNRQSNKLITATDFIDDEFQPENIYYEICKQRQRERVSRYELLCRLNTDRCQSRPLYGSDVLTQVKLAMSSCNRLKRTTFSGYTSCHDIYKELNTIKDYFSTTNTLQQLIKSNKDILTDYQHILDRFIMCTTKVIASPIELCQLNGISLRDKTIQQKPFIEVLSSTDFEVLSSINQIKQNMFLQFPERRLIQYDCGKLQTLDILLNRLKREKHRCLIFTQMTKMLDILELFLNHHGYTYVRLDGTTQIVQRQMLMERFNSDEKIFVFILSTRAGGIGVNLTGADTVIFYDSDWNPTMDAQAQDRCHRIGQTKDVHIYRLISRNTVEENILKKANQKRLLGDLTIDGGSFDVAYFKKNNIRDLFDQSATLEDIVRERNNYQQHLDTTRSPATTTATVTPSTTSDNNLTLTQYEEALATVEDETDRLAADELNKEVKAELNEFNEDEANEVNELNEDQLIEKQKRQMNKVEEELKTFDEQLRPIERYALRCVEAYRHEHQLAQVAPNTYLDTEQIRKDWEITRLKTLKEEEEKQLEQEDDEMMYTYALDNERQTKYSYTYSAAQNSLVANELARHEKTSAAIATSQSSLPPPLVALSSIPSPSLAPTPPPPPPPAPPSLPRPVLIKRSSQTPNENFRRRRVQIPSSPLLPPPSLPQPKPSIPSISVPPPPALIQKPNSNTTKNQQTLSRIIKNRHNSNDDCVDSTTLLVADDFDDDDDEDDDFNNDNRIYSSKSKTTLSTITRKPISNLTRVTQNPSSSSSTTNSNGQQQIWIVNSLDQQSVLSLINYINPNSPNNSRSTGSVLVSNKSNMNTSPVTNLLTQQQPRSSSTAGTVYQIRPSQPTPPQQQQQSQQPQQQSQQPQPQQQNVVYQIQNGRIFQSTKKTT